MCLFHYGCPVIVIISPLKVLQNYYMFLEAVLLWSLLRSGYFGWGARSGSGFGAEEEKVRK